MVIGKDGHAHQTAVKTGIRDDHDVQILSGLDAGAAGGDRRSVRFARRHESNDYQALLRKPAAAGPNEDGSEPAMTNSSRSTPRVPEESQRAAEVYWFAREHKSIIFLIVTLALVGAYLAFSIPIAVFPTTDFPRVLIGVDNGVMPIDQMLVTITRPIEEAVRGVQGIEDVRSITSRGSAEIDLYFSWRVDMFQTLQRVNAALARVQSTLPPTAQITTDQLEFSSFPILGYGLTSDKVSQAQLWEIATYEVKPRLASLTGVSTILVQGGEVPEFHIVPDPAKLRAAAVSISDILAAVDKSNIIQSPGTFLAQSSVVPRPDQRPGA